MQSLQQSCNRVHATEMHSVAALLQANTAFRQSLEPEEQPARRQYCSSSVAAPLQLLQQTYCCSSVASLLQLLQQTSQSSELHVTPLTKPIAACQSCNRAATELHVKPLTKPIADLCNPFRRQRMCPYATRTAPAATPSRDALLLVSPIRTSSISSNIK